MAQLCAAPRQGTSSALAGGEAGSREATAGERKHALLLAQGKLHV